MPFLPPTGAHIRWSCHEWPWYLVPVSNRALRAPTPELARIPIFCPRAYCGVFVPSRGETEYRHTAAVQCARVRGALRAARCANRFDSICRLAAAGVPLLRCAARRRVRIGCGVSWVPARCSASAPLAAVLCILAPRICAAGSGRAVVAFCAPRRQLRALSPPRACCSFRGRSGSCPALCTVKRAF